jgi:mannose-6-phosphate isomerase-like protein (cupin superfamily)
MFLIHESDAEPYELVGRTTRLLIGAASGSRHLTHNVSSFPPGHAPGHVHDPEEEVFYVDRGNGEIWIDGVPFAIGPGSTVHTPMGVEHNVHITGSEPMRIIGDFSPHVVPGRYPNLPARSVDLPEPPTNEAAFVARADFGEVTGERRLVTTERMTVSIRGLPTDDRWTVAADRHDVIFHVLDGSGTITAADTTYRIRPGSVVLLTGDDGAVVAARERLRLLVVVSVEAG